MRINVHAHTFNLRAVRSRFALDVLRRRLEHEIEPRWLGRAVGKAVDDVLSAVEDFNDEALARSLSDRLARRLLSILGGDQEALDRFLGGEEADAPLDVRNALAGLLDGLAGDRVDRVFDWLVGRFRRHPDFRRNDLYDALQTLRIAGLPSIQRVTDWLMDQVPADAGVVPLTLDITDGGDDGEGFRQQLEETSRTVLAYPGRVLPFVFVHPRREGHLEIMRRALTERGFVGVKLYPSLGYDVTSDAMLEVYRESVRLGAPLLQHTNKGGFVVSEDSFRQADPVRWRPILERDEFADLKICFAHFGGGGQVTVRPLSATSWAAVILEMMRGHPGVFADVSFHRKPMDSDAEAGRYFANLTDWLADPVTGERILFGTDFWLIRPRLSEASHWRFYEDGLTGDQMEQMATANTHRFLGLPPAGMSPAVSRYVQFIADNLDAVGDLIRAPAPPWLLEALAPAARRALEEAGRAIEPHRRLALPGWRDLVTGLGDRTLAEEVDLEVATGEVDLGGARFEGIDLGLEAEAALSVQSARDDFRVVFARLPDDRFRVVVHKLDTHGAAFRASLGATVSMDDPGALEDLLVQLVADDLPDVDRLRDRLREEIEAITQECFEAGFTYEYERISSHGTLLQATLPPAVVAELHHRLVRGDLVALLDRVLAGDREVLIEEFLRQKLVVRRRAWGFNLGGVGSRNETQLRFVEQARLDEEERPVGLTVAYRGLRSYRGEWLGEEEEEYRVDFKAETDGFLPPARITVSDLGYELAFALRWRDRLGVTTLEAALDCAALWGALPPGGDAFKAAVAGERRRFEELGLFGEPVTFDLQLVLRGDALRAAVPSAATGEPSALARALAAAMPYRRDSLHGTPTGRRDLYAPLWLQLLRDAADAPSFRLDADRISRYAHLAADRVRSVHPGLAHHEEEGQQPWTFAGRLRLDHRVSHDLASLLDGLRLLRTALSGASEQSHRSVRTLFERRSNVSNGSSARVSTCAAWAPTCSIAPAPEGPLPGPPSPRSTSAEAGRKPCSSSRPLSFSPRPGWA